MPVDLKALHRKAMKAMSEMQVIRYKTDHLLGITDEQLATMLDKLNNAIAAIDSLDDPRYFMVRDDLFRQRQAYDSFLFFRQQRGK